MDEFDKKIMEYNKRFEDGFPMMPLAWGRTEEQVIKIIDHCLKANKDVYELGYLDPEDDAVY